MTLDLFFGGVVFEGAAAAAMTLDLFFEGVAFEEEVEVEEALSVVDEAKAAKIDAGVSLFAARLPEGETEPTPAERIVTLLAIEGAGRAGRRGAEESMATLQSLKERDLKNLFDGALCEKSLLLQAKEKKSFKPKQCEQQLRSPPRRDPLRAPADAPLCLRPRRSR